MQEIQQSIFDFLQDNNNFYLFLSIVFTILIGFLAVLWIVRKSARKGAILLVGLCDAGKTLMFFRLVHGKFRRTQSSLKENSGLYASPNEQFSCQLVDIPGHERIRQQHFDKFKASAKAIIFVIDSSLIQRELKDVAECLFALLCDPVVVSLPMLIACNKRDVILARGSGVVKSLLEKELTVLKKTKSAAHASIDGAPKPDYSGRANLGGAKSDFEFAKLKHTKVTFVECSALGAQGEGGPHDLNDVIQWIDSLL